MPTVNWKIETINRILPEEFHALIESNREHIKKTFPVTLDSCTTIEKTFFFMAQNIEKEKNSEGFYFYVRNTETKKLIGYACIKNVTRSIMKCELAYFIDKEFEGKGIISTVVAQITAKCFTEFNMNKVFICTSKINAGSQKVATKNGFQQEGILRGEFRSGEGVLEDIVYFGLLKSEWNER